MAISVLLVALTMVGVIFQVVSRAKASNVPGSVTVRSVRQPREILKAARQFFGDGGWMLETRTLSAQTFSYKLRPAGPEVVVLLILGLLPGLAYLVAGKRSVTVIVASDPDGVGSATVVSWSNSGACEQRCRDFALMVRSQEPESSESRQRVRIRRRKRVRSGFAT